MKKIDSRIKSMTLRLLCSICLCASLMCSLLMMGKLVASDIPWTTNAGSLFGIAIMCFGLYELLYYFYSNIKEKNKFNIAHIIYAILGIISGLLAIIFSKNVTLFFTASIIYFLIPFAQRITEIIKNHTKRNILLNVILIILITVIFIALIVNVTEIDKKKYFFAAFLPGAIIPIICVVKICSLALSNFNKKVLKKVIIKTYAGEIIFGLLLLMLAFSMVLVYAEESINNIFDGLWYCFMLVTTIGFGDITTVTHLGRLLSVILGIYGIIVVAIVTSIIVNFYNEVRIDNALPKDQSTEQLESKTELDIDKQNNTEDSKE